MCRHTRKPHLLAKVARCACRHIGAHWTTTRSSPRCALAPGNASPGLSNARLTQSRPGEPPSPARECPHQSEQRGTVALPGPANLRRLRFALLLKYSAEQLNTLVNFESALLGLDGQFSVGGNTFTKN